MQGAWEKETDRGGGEGEGELFHPLLEREVETQAAAAAALRALAAAEAALAEARRGELAVQQARRVLEEGAAEYAALAASDFSVAVSQQVEQKRLAALAGEVEKRTADALTQVQVQRAKAREAKAAHALAQQLAARLLQRRDAAVLALYVPVRQYLTANTTAAVTFSARDKAAAAQAKRELAAGNLRGVNEDYIRVCVCVCARACVHIYTCD